MSAAVDNFKNGWITMSASFVIAMVTVVFGSSLGAKEADKREQARQQEEYQKQVQIEMSKKADLEYVDKRFVESEKIQNAYFQGISDMFGVTQQQLKDIREDIRNLRK